MDSIFVPLILTEDSHRGEKMMENLHKLASVLQISAGNERVRLHSQILDLSFTNLIETGSHFVSNERNKKNRKANHPRFYKSTFIAESPLQTFKHEPQITDL